mmetsp:Transcript_27798/g.74136  ORF Transcript_27798/g.74136 Transcript_27798/m.74136 type:complete len:218 (-) Transcript_27798:144-797(-)
MVGLATSHPSPTVPQHHCFLSAGQLFTQSEKPSLQSTRSVRVSVEMPVVVLEAVVVEASVVGGCGQPRWKFSQHQSRLYLDQVSRQFEYPAAQSNAVVMVVDVKSQPKPEPWEQHQVFFSRGQATSQFDDPSSQSNRSVAEVVVLVAVVATVSLFELDGQPTPKWEQHQVFFSRGQAACHSEYPSSQSNRSAAKVAVLVVVTARVLLFGIAGQPTPE